MTIRMEQVSREHSTLGNVEGNVKTLLCVLNLFLLELPFNWTPIIVAITKKQVIFY